MKSEEINVLTDKEYLLDLSERIMNIPVIYDVDQHDCDRLIEISEKVKS